MYFKALTKSRTGNYQPWFKYEIGKATPKVNYVRVCNSGYHLSTIKGIFQWTKTGNVLYMAKPAPGAKKSVKEYDFGLIHKDKAAFSSIIIGEKIGVLTKKRKDQINNFLNKKFKLSSGTNNWKFMLNNAKRKEAIGTILDIIRGNLD